MSKENGVTCSVEERVFTICLDRPKKMNALTFDMARHLQAKILEASERSDVHCLLLTASGRAFCAGRDISDAAPNEDSESFLRDIVNPLITTFYHCPKPTLAAVNGAAMGIGLGLALAADVVLAGRAARFSSPFARLGGALDSGGHYFLSRRIGEQRAFELIYTGKVVTGEQANAWGLVSRVVSDNILQEAALQMARDIAAGPQMAFKAQKEVLRQAAHSSLASILDLEAKVQGELAQTNDYAEGIAAFKEGRMPSFGNTVGADLENE